MNNSSLEVWVKGAVLFERLAPYRSHLFRFTKDSLQGLSDEIIHYIHDYMTANKASPEKIFSDAPLAQYPRDVPQSDISYLLFNVEAMMYAEKRGIIFSQEPEDVNSGFLYCLAGYLQHVPK
ncbi:hypothetical protein K9M74_02875 [Candidatus Woesearchaeota archaeon]|nr:hypothetical protein [Candidatus Woesearchaeota archaeon]